MHGAISGAATQVLPAFCIEMKSISSAGASTPSGDDAAGAQGDPAALRTP